MWNCGTPQKVRIACPRAEIWTRDLPSTKPHYNDLDPHCWSHCSFRTVYTKTSFLHFKEGLCLLRSYSKQSSPRISLRVLRKHLTFRPQTPVFQVLARLPYISWPATQQTYGFILCCTDGSMCFTCQLFYMHTRKYNCNKRYTSSPTHSYWLGPSCLRQQTPALETTDHCISEIIHKNLWNTMSTWFCPLKYQF